MKKLFVKVGILSLGKGFVSMRNEAMSVRVRALSMSKEAVLKENKSILVRNKALPMGKEATLKRIDAMSMNERALFARKRVLSMGKKATLKRIEAMSINERTLLARKRTLFMGKEVAFMKEGAVSMGTNACFSGNGAAMTERAACRVSIQKRTRSGERVRCRVCGADRNATRYNVAELDSFSFLWLKSYASVLSVNLVRLHCTSNGLRCQPKALHRASIRLRNVPTGVRNVPMALRNVPMALLNVPLRMLSLYLWSCFALLGRHINLLRLRNVSTRQPHANFGVRFSKFRLRCAPLGSPLILLGRRKTFTRRR